MKTITLTEKVVVSDPCYEIPTWCQAVIDGVLPGNYNTTVLKQDEGAWGVRCSHIIAIHEDYKDTDKFKWTYHPASIGVDSGQAGIFSFDSYRNDNHKFDFEPYHFSDNWDSKEGDLWYRHMCRQTLSDEQWGMYDSGIVSSSGYGDGSYILYVARKKKKIVGFIIEFIHDNKRRPLKKIVEEDFFHVQY